MCVYGIFVWQEKVYDIHNITGLLKDFLRSLSEPLVTFRLHGTFMRAAGLPDPEDSITFTYQAISELPLVNRDTLAYVVLHLQRWAKSLWELLFLFSFLVMPYVPLHGVGNKWIAGIKCSSMPKGLLPHSDPCIIYLFISDLLPGGLGITII